jgi:hypothetical protein
MVNSRYPEKLGVDGSVGNGATSHVGEEILDV